jgi:hypothetical protein
MISSIHFGWKSTLLPPGGQLDHGALSRLRITLCDMRVRAAEGINQIS